MRAVLVCIEAGAETLAPLSGRAAVVCLHKSLVGLGASSRAGDARCAREDESGCTS